MADSKFQDVYNQPDPPRLRICAGCAEADYIEEITGEYGTTHSHCHRRDERLICGAL